jgi:hypothetical protein
MIGALRGVLLAVMNCQMDRECLIRAFCPALTRFYANVFTQGYPRFVGQRIVYPGLNGPAAECLLLSEGIVSTTLGRIGSVRRIHM